MTRLARYGAAAALVLACATTGGFAQNFPAPGGGRDGTCQRLEAQLAAIDRTAADPARAEQIRRYEEAAGRQQGEIDRTVAQSRRLGCEASGFFQLFGGGGRSNQCDPLNNQIQQMRANLSRIQNDLQRLQGAGANYERDGQRRAVLAALSQNDCGPQYRAAATQSRGFFESLFGGGGSIMAPEQDSYQGGGGYRTVCVRTCDGYFFPISFSTSVERFREDEAACQRMCPASEVVLFSHRNPGEDMTRAVSLGGRLYTELPNAFRYKSEFNPACACKRPGESWADAVRQNEGEQTYLERGDILVTEERAKQMSAPRDAKGRPIMPPQRPAQQRATPAAAQSPSPSPEAVQPAPEDGEKKKPIRSVGPRFLPEQ